MAWKRVYAMALILTFGVFGAALPGGNGGMNFSYSKTYSWCPEIAAGRFLEPSPVAVKFDNFGNSTPVEVCRVEVLRDGRGVKGVPIEVKNQILDASNLNLIKEINDKIKTNKDGYGKWTVDLSNLFLPPDIISANAIDMKGPKKVDWASLSCSFGVTEQCKQNKTTGCVDFLGDDRFKASMKYLLPGQREFRDASFVRTGPGFAEFETEPPERVIFSFGNECKNRNFSSIAFSSSPSRFKHEINVQDTTTGQQNTYIGMSFDRIPVIIQDPKAFPCP